MIKITPRDKTPANEEKAEILAMMLEHKIGEMKEWRLIGKDEVVVSRVEAERYNHNMILLSPYGV